MAHDDSKKNTPVQAAQRTPQMRSNDERVSERYGTQERGDLERLMCSYTVESTRAIPKDAKRAQALKALMQAEAELEQDVHQGHDKPARMQQERKSHERERARCNDERDIELFAYERPTNAGENSPSDNLEQTYAKFSGSVRGGSASVRGGNQNVTRDTPSTLVWISTDILSDRHPQEQVEDEDEQDKCDTS
jgi:hypothetical protein